MSITTLVLFSLVALVAIATPGPTVLLALSNGSRYGVRRALPGMLGAVARSVGQRQQHGGTGRGNGHQSEE